MSVKINFRLLSDGSRSVRLVIYDPFTHKRTYEKLDVRILKRDSEKKQKIEWIESLRSKRESELFLNVNPTLVTRSSVTTIKYIESRIEFINDKSIRQYQAMLIHAKKCFPLKLKLQETTPNHIQYFADYLYQKLSRNSANNYLTKLSRIFNDAIRDNLINQNPLHRINRKPKLKSSQKEILLIDEFKKLYSFPFYRIEQRGLKQAVLLSYYSGMGLTDINNFKRNQIRGNTLKYKRIKTGVGVTIKIKGSVLSSMPVTKKNDLLFPNLPLRQNVNHILKAWTELAGIDKHITFYSLRHSFAVNLLLSGINIERVRQLMGHVTLDQTKEYLKYIEMMDSKEDELLPDFM